MNVKKLMNKMTLQYKYEILARFFYYIEQNENISFNDINSEERNLCYFVAHRYIQDNKADELIEALIFDNDSDYIKATEDYILMRNKECQQQKEIEAE